MARSHRNAGIKHPRILFYLWALVHFRVFWQRAMKDD